VEFGLEKCARLSVKCGKVHGQHIGNKVENEIKELESKSVEESRNIEHKNV